MPRVDVPVTNLSRAGVNDASPTNGDATNNHTIANDGKVWFEVSNADASNPHNLTVHVQDTVDGQVVASRVYAIAASGKKRLGPWPVGDYGSSLLVDVDSSQLKLTAYHLG